MGLPFPSGEQWEQVAQTALSCLLQVALSRARNGPLCAIAHRKTQTRGVSGAERNFYVFLTASARTTWARGDFTFDLSNNQPDFNAALNGAAGIPFIHGTHLPPFRLDYFINVSDGPFSCPFLKRRYG
jgi:hypothetical protein